jgi:Mrp family chromosome partitioning ATPase
VSSLSARGANPQDTVAGVVAAVERLSLNEPVHRLVLVGSDDGVDRAEIALALACMVARSFGQPVALIDADLDNSVLTSMLGTGDGPGLAECLAGQLDPEAALVALSDVRLPAAVQAMQAPDGMVRFLGAGVDTSRNILRMRSTFHRVLEGLAGRYVVIVNGPRLPGPVPTAQLLSLADATLMVVAEGGTSLTDARAAGDTLRSFSSGASGIIVQRR